MSVTAQRALSASYLQEKFAAALTYERYLETDPEKAARWKEMEREIALSDDQRSLVTAFSRDVRVLVVSGIWCGDCAVQGPMIEAIAQAGDRIRTRYLERDQHHDLAEALAINRGLRVPVVLFMAEDFEPVSIFGDRTLTRYRAIAAKSLGPACPLPGAPVPDDELDNTLQDWLDEFERVHLLLRLSGRLRQQHGD